MPAVLRRPVAGRRPRRIERGPFNVTRLAGALVMLAASGALNWLTSPDQFRLAPDGVTIAGLHYTDPALATERVAPLAGGGPNLFRLRTSPIVRALAGLPAVARVEAWVQLPDALLIRVVEREPLFVWRSAGSAVLVDGAGAIITSARPDSGSLPEVTDSRRRSAAPEVGGMLDSLDLAAVLKLAALTPARLGSRATALSLSVDDENGYVLAADEPAWRAVFGHYTPNLRPPAMIDQQVQCLGSLLAEREGELAIIYLSPSDERCGTYRARPTPGGRIFQNVAGQHATSGKG